MKTLDLHTPAHTQASKPAFLDWYAKASEHEQVSWLMQLFNSTFAQQHIQLVRSAGEPEYFPAIYHDSALQDNALHDNSLNDSTLVQPAKIAFAHGFFASALHEISHWCIAGKHRRTLPDFGYWYEPDGRNVQQQAAFETVEIKPQALEWLFSAACLRQFRVSVDNLNGEPTDSTGFKKAVYAQVQRYLSGEDKLPADANTWLKVLCQHCRPHTPLQATDFHLADI